MGLRHPGGMAATLRLLQMAGLGSPLGTPSGKDGEATKPRALDMGAGDGNAVRLLRELGWEAMGIDRSGGKDVLSGDMLQCPFEDGSFGLVLSECAFFVSGDAEGAIREAERLLEPDGLLLLGDIYFGNPVAWRHLLERCGLHVIALEDVTAQWREYYLAAIWNGTMAADCRLPGRDCRYFLTVARKGMRT